MIQGNPNQNNYNKLDSQFNNITIDTSADTKLKTTQNRKSIAYQNTTTIAANILGATSHALPSFSNHGISTNNPHDQIFSTINSSNLTLLSDEEAMSQIPFHKMDNETSNEVLYVGSKSPASSVTEPNAKAVTEANDKAGKEISSKIYYKDSEGIDRSVTETAVRADTVSSYSDSLKSKLMYLEKKIDEFEAEEKADPKKAEDLRKKIETTRNAIKRTNNQLDKVKQLQEKGSSWASTSAIRLLFKKSFKKATAHYNFIQRNIQYKNHGVKLARKCAKNDYVPVLANLRNQKVSQENDAGEIKVLSNANRSAAITDFAHNETNLMEMKDYLLLEELKNGKEISSEEKERLLAMYDLTTPDSNDRLESVMKNIKKNIEDAYPPSDLNSTKMDRPMEDIITERRENLENLFLQDLMLHLESGAKCDRCDPTRFTYSRESLVDMTKKPSNEDHGLVLSEKNQELDTYEILQELNGKKILFEEIDAAFIDPFDHNIHLPIKYQQLSEAPSNEISLDTFATNISVQGNTKNKGIQNFINQETFKNINGKLKEMKNYNDQAFLKAKTEEKDKRINIAKKITQLELMAQEIHTDITNGKKGFDLAEKIGVFLKEFGNISVNCYGGKDRTGFMLALLTFNCFFPVFTCLKDEIQIKITESSKNINHIGKQLISKTSVALKIVADNIGHFALKLLPFKLKLYFNKDQLIYISGIKQRISDYAKAITIKVNFSPLSNVGDGQIYEK